RSLLSTLYLSYLLAASLHSCLLYFSLLRPETRSTLFPYTTLFRSDIENHIRTIGLYRTKAKHLKETAQIITEKFDGQIPKDKKILMTLPGVGEKTANVVLAEGFKVPAIAVDTHVSRISKRFNIVSAKATPHEVEKRLEELLPKEEWIH